MKLVIIGGTGLIGSRLVRRLREQGHEAFAASPGTGVNSLTGEGLAESLQGASVVVDVSNSPSWEDAAVVEFFTRRIADDATDGTTVRVPTVLIQPMAADDVARAVGRIAAGAPLNDTVEVAGPQQFRFDELIRQSLEARNDPREVIADAHALYFGARLGERSLIPDGARIGEIHFQEWLDQPVLQP